MNTALLSAIVNSEELPSIPAVALKVIELCREDDIDIQDVADAISTDPALTIRMLKSANSSMFGMSKTVSSLSQAMVVLGIRTVKVMALGFALADTVKSGKKGTFDFPTYWRRSLTTAVAARQLAEEYGGIRKDEAFVAGLLSDIGMIAIQQHCESEYGEVVRRSTDGEGRIHEIEQDIFEITHADVSAMMMANWSMPEAMCHAIRAHHGNGLNELEPRSKSVGIVLCAASDIASLFSGDIDPSQSEAVFEDAIARTGVSREFLDSVVEVLNANVSEAAEMFSVDLGKEVSYDQLRQSAMQEIMNISMSAEQERKSTESQMESLRHKAETDRLTGIANRQAFDDHIATVVNETNQSKGEVGLIMMDIDHFKKLNDTHGHQAGDEALRRVGACVDNFAKESQFVARYGGEEFAIVAAESSARKLRELAEEVRESISKIRFQHNGTPLQFTASLGAAHVDFTEESVDVVELIRRADECLYEAKQDGRNRVEITF